MGTRFFRMSQARQAVFPTLRSGPAGCCVGGRYLKKCSAPLSLRRRESFVTNVFYLISSLVQGGVEQHLLDLVRQLDPNRFATDICVLNDRVHFKD